MWLVVAITLASLVAALIFLKRSSDESDSSTRLDALTNQKWNYRKMKQLIGQSQISLPAMFVDLDIFDANVKLIMSMVRPTGKSLRIATKSIRSPELIKRISSLSGGVVVSFMCYSIQEAQLLAREGLDDFYIAYPIMQRSDVATALSLVVSGRKVTLTIDCVAHAQRLDDLCEEIWGRKRQESGEVKSSPELRVAIDLDVSYKLCWGKIHSGAHRSKVDSVETFAPVADAVFKSRHLRLAGVMGYEAHVAGLPDNDPYSPLPNQLVRHMKKLFYGKTTNLRHQIARYCHEQGIILDFFNGGGSGNIGDVARDQVLTEVTAGSAFLQAKLFDYYVSNECSPAFAFALQATRINSDYLCCQSGGFVASGSCNLDKVPVPFANPLQLSSYPDEGFGEVQTPLRIGGRNPGTEDDVIGIGDPVFFRPAKSGEIGEHFREYILKRGYQIVGKAATYRGVEKVFY